MKTLLTRFSSLVAVGSMFAAIASAAPTPPSVPGVVGYSPVEKTVQGNQPLSQSYTLTITSPANLTPGVSVTIALDPINNLNVLSKPVGVSDATAKSFISLSPASLTFTGRRNGLPGRTTVARVAARHLPLRDSHCFLLYRDRDIRPYVCVTGLLRGLRGPA